MGDKKPGRVEKLVGHARLDAARDRAQEREAKGADARRTEQDETEDTKGEQ